MTPTDQLTTLREWAEKSAELVVLNEFQRGYCAACRAVLYHLDEVKEEE